MPLLTGTSPHTAMCTDRARALWPDRYNLLWRRSTPNASSTSDMFWLPLFSRLMVVSGSAPQPQNLHVCCITLNMLRAMQTRNARAQRMSRSQRGSADGSVSENHTTRIAPVVSTSCGSNAEVTGKLKPTGSQPWTQCLLHATNCTGIMIQLGVGP